MSATTSNSQYTSLASELTTIQSTASDSGDNGISEALGNFFDAWSTLGQDPTGSAEQAQVNSAAQSLVSSIQSTYSQLSQISDQLPGQIDDTVDQANSLINQIAQLNTAITQYSTPASEPNNLIDEQHQAMDSLSQLIPVSFSTQSNGMVTVSSSCGRQFGDFGFRWNGTGHYRRFQCPYRFDRRGAARRPASGSNGSQRLYEFLR